MEKSNVPLVKAEEKVDTSSELTWRTPERTVEPPKTYTVATTPVAVEAEKKSLSDVLKYALQYSTTEGALGYLRRFDGKLEPDENQMLNSLFGEDVTTLRDRMEMLLENIATPEE